MALVTRFTEVTGCRVPIQQARWARGLWAQADRIVTDQAPYVPLYNEASGAFVSSRVGNYQDSPEYGPLPDQMWVR